MLKAKEEELEAVRGGASVESSLASSALKQVRWNRLHFAGGVPLLLMGSNT